LARDRAVYWPWVLLSRDFESRAGREAKCCVKSLAGQGRLLVPDIEQRGEKIK